MGMSDPILYENLYINVEAHGDTALLGFSNHNRFDGDLYDRSLDNWEINSQWKLKKKYDTIICLRTAYFAKDPIDFLNRCYDSLKDDGVLYVDWGYGDHWRFSDYKIGWVKNDEHEYAYGEKNYLHSALWDNEKIGNDDNFRMLKEASMSYGYSFEEINESLIYNEVPSVITYEDIEEKYNILGSKTYFFCLPCRPPSYYILLCLKKRHSIEDPLLGFSW